MQLSNSIIVIFFLTFSNLYAQQKSPYQLNLQKSLPLLVGGGILGGTGQIIQSKMALFTEEEIQALDVNSISPFDRSATRNWSPQSASLSDVLLGVSVLAPLGLLVNPGIRSDAATVGLMYAETLLVSGGLTNITKVLTKRTRPFVYNENAPLAPKLTPTARLSFFSGHASLAAASSFFFAKVFSDYYPDSPHRIWIWGLAVSIPAVTAYLRYDAGKHYPSDVILGYAVGAFMGWLIPQLHKQKPLKMGNARASLSLSYQRLGMGLRF